VILTDTPQGQSLELNFARKLPDENGVISEAASCIALRANSVTQK
jgi:hypothetical protein